MTDFPATANAFLEDGIDQGELRQRMQDQLLATKQLIGAVGVEDITIASGSITPTRGTVRMLYQGTAVDDLVSIVTTNLPDGSLLLLSIKDEGYAITVKHGTGAGNVKLSGSIDFVMNKLEQRLLIQRMGTVWNEVARFGRGATGAFSFGSGWAALPGSRFDVDELNDVRCNGTVQAASLSATPSTMWTFAAGNRPLTTLYFPIHCTVAGVSEHAFATVSTSGVVAWNRLGAAPSSAVVNVNIDPIRFRAYA